MGGYRRDIPDCLWTVVYKESGEQASVGSYEEYRFYEREDLAQKAIKRCSRHDAPNFGYPTVDQLEVKQVWLVDLDD